MFLTSGTSLHYPVEPDLVYNGTPVPLPFPILFQLHSGLGTSLAQWGQHVICICIWIVSFCPFGGIVPQLTLHLDCLPLSSSTFIWRNQQVKVNCILSWAALPFYHLRECKSCRGLWSVSIMRFFVLFYHVEFSYKSRAKKLNMKRSTRVDHRSQCISLGKRICFVVDLTNRTRVPHPCGILSWDALLSMNS